MSQAEAASDGYGAPSQFAEMMAHPRLDEFKAYLYDGEGEQRPLVEEDCEAFERWRERLSHVAAIRPRLDEAPRGIRARARPLDPAEARPARKLAPPRVTPESLNISPDAMRLLESYAPSG